MIIRCRVVLPVEVYFIDIIIYGKQFNEKISCCLLITDCEVARFLLSISDCLKKL